MHRVVRFGEYQFDLDGGQLWRDSQEVRITPKAAAVLKTLLARPGQPVTKQDLFAAVWKGTVVGDDALTSCVQELRRALHDDPKQPRYIETRHRSGYRFIAHLAEVAPETSEPATHTPRISTIAVLPFADMSPARDQDYLCEGLAEEIINVLARVDRLRVAARAASLPVPRCRRRRGRGRTATQRGYVVDGRRAQDAAASCASPCSWWTWRPATSAGPSDSTASSTTSSRCRTRSRRRWSPGFAAAR